ncbi:NAD(P)-dependent oxidoreductase [Mycobacterium sherrisii]|uniref:6-phosphogluconate dehydrogenase n=1 Tax=Mycobacterium sherrisii TaxID=243061 RepID=A0A1E3T8Y6_9MYCO|nr:NAD(P)-dependent oxidoreductase [Mycobacterium sherrisii]MCV7031793.1 NAD(P)-dependent oxidoreductase [Mycobacterium sherrisii]MEC4762983.1 NAD(P)-dependent oxidoreductase [Mycobacterium sherrisii]ODR10867.1 6-phosphogluconate dehydrogenase [Mycobacterium sherrisii]ORW86237.1 6-phosphogluconate dehydrogenase [Mycobacterium sherrisii]
MRVGFIGLGNQGGPMARRIIESGFPTTLWARRPASVAAFDDTPATIADSPAELAAASDLICLCVVRESDIDEVAGGEHGLLAGVMPGSVIAVHSTVHPDTCKSLAKKADAKGVSVIDAPVSGGGPAAAERRLVVMVGGDADTVESCRPVFETYGDPVVHLGELGTGQTAKLLNNLLFTAQLGTAATALWLAQSLGIAGERLVEVVARSSGNSFALNALRGIGGLDRLAGMAGPLLQKDVRLIGDLITAVGADGGAVLAAADAALTLMDHPR